MLDKNIAYHLIQEGILHVTITLHTWNWVTQSYDNPSTENTVEPCPKSLVKQAYGH